MFYYQRQIGDYAAATRHLTLLEHGVYSMMLDLYYLNESPLPADIEKLCRLIGARSDDERKAVVSIADEFFENRDGKLWQTRCDSEISKIHGKSEKAKASAQARWLKQPKSECNADAMRSHSGCNADGMLSKTQDPRPKTQEIHTESATPERAVDQGCALAEVIAMYHEQLPMLPRVKIVSPKRKALLKTRQRDYPKAKDVEWWQAFFERAAESKFLTGNAGGNWLADFDFLLSPKGFTGVIEGKYQ